MPSEAFWLYSQKTSDSIRGAPTQAAHTYNKGALRHMWEKEGWRYTGQTEAGASFREPAQGLQLSATQRWKKNPEQKKRICKPHQLDNKRLKTDVQAYPDNHQ